MYLSAYRFTVDPGTLAAAHDALLATFPPESLHVCVQTEDGILVLDTCPSRAVFESFNRSVEFRSALAAAGLPEPAVEPLGEVRSMAPEFAIARPGSR